MNNILFASMAFSICALFYELFIIAMYFNKKKFKNIENTLFLIILGLTLFLIINEFIYVYLISINDVTDKATIFFCRLYLIGIITWMCLLLFYMYALNTKSIEDIEKKKKKRKIFLIIDGIFYIVIIISSSLLPIKIHNTGIGHFYGFDGPAVEVGYLLAFLLITFVLYVFFIKKNNIQNNQKKSLLMALICIIGTVTLQFFFPSLDYNMQNFQFVMLLMALFFTLENQDNKLLQEHEISKSKSEKANREQTEFLTSMSHEIRTPMNTIMGFSDVLIREGAVNKEAVKNDTDNIHKAAVSLLELINNILDISRVESGKEALVEKDFDTKTLLVELNDLVYSKIDPLRIKFQLFYPEDLPSILYGDYTKINKIISNLLINTISYTKTGSIQLIIKKNLIDNNSKCEIDFVVMSEGSYINQNDFEKYYKDDTTSSNRINNAVLGLSVAKLYAKMMGSGVAFNSNYGKNITYVTRILCPVINPTPIGNITHLLDSVHNSNKINLEGKKILVVDDNLMNIKLLNRLLIDYKPTLESSMSGQDCITKVSENDYDLIFLDHMMPGMDGIQTLQKLKDLKSNLPPVVALTANSYAGIKEMYTSNGFNDYLAKPINRNDLNRLLESIFTKK